MRFANRNHFILSCVPATTRCSMPTESGFRPLRIAAGLMLALSCCSYYLWIDGLVGRPPRGQHKSPAVVAQELARTTGASWRTVRNIADDGTYLEAWMFIPPSNRGRAAIVVHEMGGSRLSLLHFVKWLLGAGYVCLVPDGRAHGMSGGSVMTYGIRERHDIVSWARTLRAEHAAAGQIVGVGVSLGGTVLLQAAAAGADLRAVVADSVGADLSTPYHHVADHVGVSEAWARRLFPLFVEPLFLNARLRHGLDLSAAAPVRAVSKLSVPVLLIHGTEDAFIPVGHARRLHAANPRHTTLWEIRGAAHTLTDEVAGKNYEERVLSFFDTVAAPAP